MLCLYPECSLVRIITPEGRIAYGVTPEVLKYNSKSDFGLTITNARHTSIIIAKPWTVYARDRLTGTSPINYTYSSMGVPLTTAIWTINAPHSVDIT